MKNWKLTLYLSAIMIAFSSILFVNNAKAQGYGQVSLDLFYNELSPYGDWDMDPNYGDVWYPNEGRNFRPYSSNGYWTMTEYGNTWVSNYDWGWAPFHYGRWVHNSHRGWGWIPGYEWGPAWVDWRSGNGYYGWAPMMPRGGVSISIHLPISSWCFAPVRHIYSRNFHRHAYYGRTNIYNRTTIINNTYVVNNNHYYGGPSRREMERTMGRKIDVRSIRQSDRPGASHVDSRNVSIYRPDRDNNRTTSRSVSADRRSSSSSREVNKNRTDNNRSAARSAQREMHIGNDGNTTIRNRENKTEDRAVTNRNSNATRSTVERSGNESVNRNTDRSTRTIERSPVQRNTNEAVRERGNGQGRGSVSSRSNEQPQRVERTQPQRVERSQPQQIERAQPQRQEKAQPQRQQRTQERSVRNTNTVQQASNTRAAQSASPRVERSAPATSSRSTGTTQRGGGSNSSERSRR